MSNDPRQAFVQMRRVIGALEQKSNQQEAILNQVLGLLKASADTPKWVEDIPGRRVPYFAPIDLNIVADATSAVEGTYTVSTDGPFVVTGVGAFFKKTSGAYAGDWGPATTYDARIAEIGQQHGYQFIYDQPHCISGDIEIIDRGSDRNWQNSSFASAALSNQAGGIYVLPTAHLLGRNSVVSAKFTPGNAIPYTGTVQILLCGYKIVQGDVYQP